MVYWNGDYIYLKNSRLLKTKNLYSYCTKINKVDVMSMRKGKESGNTRKKFVRKFKNCYLIPLSIDGIRSYF